MRAAAYIRLKRRCWKVELAHVAVLVLIAFNLQAYIAQSHIEGWQLRISDGLNLTHSAPAKAPATGHRGRLQCPFCLAVLHAGAFIGPAPLLWHAPSLWMHVVLTMLNLRQRRPALAHIWRSRAPPAL
jgi:hypothetical protein